MKLHYDRKKNTIILDGEDAFIIVKSKDYGKTNLSPEFIQFTKEAGLSFTMQNFNILKNESRIINIDKKINSN